MLMFSSIFFALANVTISTHFDQFGSLDFDFVLFSIRWNKNNVQKCIKNDVCHMKKETEMIFLNWWRTFSVHFILFFVTFLPYPTFVFFFFSAAVYLSLVRFWVCIGCFHFVLPEKCICFDEIVHEKCSIEKWISLIWHGTRINDFLSLQIIMDVQCHSNSRCVSNWLAFVCAMVLEKIMNEPRHPWNESIGWRAERW